MRCRLAQLMSLWLGLLMSAEGATVRCPAHSQGHLAVIIDDLGYNLERAAHAASIPAPLTLAIIPGTPHATAVAALGSQHGKELMVHMPMASASRAVSDPMVLEAHSSRDQMRIQIREALQSVPGATGMNNHMGSALTADRNAMDALMSELASLDLYFIDSRTTGDTVAQAAAQDWGVPSASRSVFLDNEQTPDAIETQLHKAVSLALSEGYAIAIGHPHTETMAVLNSLLPRLPSEVTVVTASQVAHCQIAQSRTSTPRSAK
ncbi:MAG: divergent polysaccharide deacetylase family protein [Luminiphilus sp.]|nr:divergent polysaccharide deacetylase family protein [Luminiphilus sp.]